MMTGTTNSKMFKTLIILNVLAIQTLPIQSNQPPVEDTTICFESSRYKIYNSRKTWNDSRSICREQGGDLASFETEDELDSFLEEVENSCNSEFLRHIGLVRVGGNWSWVSGIPLTICKQINCSLSLNGRDEAMIDTRGDKRHVTNENQGQPNASSPKEPHICEKGPSPSPTPSPSPSPSPSSLPSPLPSPSPSPSALLLPFSSPSTLLLPFPLSSPSPSPSPSSISTSSSSRAFQQLGDVYVSEFAQIDILRRSSMQEVVSMFEDFTIKIKNVTKTSEGKRGIKEDKAAKESILRVAAAFEEFALEYGKQHLSQKKLSERFIYPNMVLGIQKGYNQNTSDFLFKGQRWQVRVDIASSNFEENGSFVVAIVYEDLHELLLTDQSIRSKADNTRYINSRMMAVAMDPKPDKLRENVILKFENLKVSTAEKHCMFWSGFNESSDGFLEKGCHVVTTKSNSEETVCRCNHLTHFAVLMDYDGSTKLTEEDETILEIITYIGLCTSIIGILLTSIIYSCLTDLRQPLSQIRLSVSMSLGAGQIIFLAGIDATESKAVCVVVAALMQYFLMAAFCWMLVEGIYLYMFVVKVYNINTKMYMYHVISWGFPIIKVAISLCIAAGKEGIESYTSDKYCWLSPNNNLIWIFVAFVAFIEVLNILILVRVIREMTTMVQPIGEDNHVQQIRLGIKACLVMTPLLGVTWLFGLLSPVDKVFAYIFTILNSTQGLLIFVLHCMRNSRIREQLKRRMNMVFPSSTKKNSTMKSLKIKPNEVGDVWAVELQACGKSQSKLHSACEADLNRPETKVTF